MYLHVPVRRNVLTHIGYFHFGNVMTQQMSDYRVASWKKKNSSRCASEVAYTVEERKKHPSASYKIQLRANAINKMPL
jgi:hypothetical protein